MATREKSSRKDSRKSAAERELRIGPGPHPVRTRGGGQEPAGEVPAQLARRLEAAGRSAGSAALMEESNKGRIPELIPIRHGRMLQSPFTFYRGAALNMAADLAGTPATGLRVQACGDCHLLQFRRVRHPERRVIFDINDLDETLPAPWEWDVKRLAASFVLACRNNGFSEGDARDAVLACVRSYREHMAEYSDMRVLDVWYASIDVEELHPDDQGQGSRASGIEKRLAKARERSVLEHDFPKLATMAGPGADHQGQPAADLSPARSRARKTCWRASGKPLPSYRETMQEDRRLLLDRFKLMDMAIKVVGVGSVGTYCAHHAADGERDGSAVPPGQAGAPLGPRSLCGQERLRQPRPAGRARLPADAIGQRHLPRLDRRASSAGISTSASSRT